METITLPVAMTAAAITAECGRLAATICPKAEVSIVIGRRNEGGIGIYEDGICGKAQPHFIHKPTFAEMFTAAEEWIIGRAAIRQNDIVRKMAIAIIEITDEHSTCTRRLLGLRFSNGEIAAYGDAALARASEMAGNAPFVIAE